MFKSKFSPAWTGFGAMVCSTNMMLANSILSYLEKKEPSKQSPMDHAHLFLIQSIKWFNLTYFGVRIVSQINMPDEVEDHLAPPLAWIILINATITVTSVALDSTTQFMMALRTPNMMENGQDDWKFSRMIKGLVIFSLTLLAGILHLLGHEPDYSYFWKDEEVPEVNVPRIIRLVIAISTALITLAFRIILKCRFSDRNQPSKQIVSNKALMAGAAGNVGLIAIRKIFPNMFLIDSQVQGQFLITLIAIIWLHDDLRDHTLKIFGMRRNKVGPVVALEKVQTKDTKIA